MGQTLKSVHILGWAMNHEPLSEDDVKISFSAFNMGPHAALCAVKAL